MGALVGAARSAVGDGRVAAGRLLAFLLGAAILVGMLAFGVPTGSFAVRLEPRLAIEPLLLLGALAVWRASGRTLGRWTLAGLVAALLLAIGIRYGDLVTRSVLGRSFDLYADTPHLRNVASMMVEGGTSTAWRTAWLGLATAVALAAVLFLALKLVDRAFESSAVRRLALGGALVAGLAFPLVPRESSVATDPWQGVDWDPWQGRIRAGVEDPMQGAIAAPSEIFAEPVTAILVRHLSSWFTLRGARLPSAVLAGRPPGTADELLEGMRHPDSGEPAHVVLVFLESYGVTLLDDPQHRPYVEGRYRDLEVALRDSGYAFRSIRARSPTFGGGSWRAHATLLSGIRLDHQRLYERLLDLESGDGEAPDSTAGSTVRIDTLIELFAGAGYRTVAFEPGIRESWPEGAALGWDRIWDAHAIAWPGPDIGWWKIPDQFTLYRLWHDELERRPPPVFAKVSLILTHIPYQPVPPLVEDWNALADGSAFSAALPSVAAEGHSRSSLSGAYVTAFLRELDVLEAFLVDLVDDNTLVIISGDHQPPKLATHDSESWSVPLHVLSRRHDLIEDWSRFGFEDTLLPEQDGPFGLEHVMPVLLDVATRRQGSDDS